MASKEVDGYTNTSLLTAVKRGNIRVLNQVLKKGADVNITLDGKLPMAVAAENGHDNVLKP